MKVECVHGMTQWLAISRGSMCSLCHNTGYKVLNNESLNQEAAQPTTPSNDGESKATNE